MSPISIDRDDGTIGLPNGHTIPPSLSQDAFRQTAMFQEARVQDYGTLPWIHYHFTGGTLEGRELLTRVCFYDQILVFVTLAVDLYGPGERD